MTVNWTRRALLSLAIVLSIPSSYTAVHGQMKSDRENSILRAISRAPFAIYGTVESIEQTKMTGYPDEPTYTIGISSIEFKENGVWSYENKLRVFKALLGPSIQNPSVGQTVLMVMEDVDKDLHYVIHSDSGFFLVQTGASIPMAHNLTENVDLFGGQHRSAYLGDPKLEAIFARRLQKYKSKQSASSMARMWLENVRNWPLFQGEVPVDLLLSIVEYPMASP